MYTNIDILHHGSGFSNKQTNKQKYLTLTSLDIVFN